MCFCRENKFSNIAKNVLTNKEKDSPWNIKSQKCIKINANPNQHIFQVTMKILKIQVKSFYNMRRSHLIYTSVQNALTICSKSCLARVNKALYIKRHSTFWWCASISVGREKISSSYSVSNFFSALPSPTSFILGCFSSSGKMSWTYALSFCIFFLSMRHHSKTI